MKKYVSFFLLSVILLSCFVSCGADEGKDTEKSSESSSSPGTDYYGEVVVPPNLEAVNYGGKDFTFLVSILGNVANYGEISGLSYTQGDVLDDAIYRRDNAIMDKYNLNFKYIETNQWRQQIELAIQSGDSHFQVAMPGTSSAVTSVALGHLYDLNSLPNLDFSKPWWNKSVLEETKIGEKNFFAIGDINLLAYDSIGIIFYNTAIAENYQIGNLYDLVKNGEWTFDKFIEIVKQVTEINTSEDTRTYGLVANNYSSLCFAYGIGQRFVLQDEDNIPYFNRSDERFVTFWKKYIDEITNSGHVKWMPNQDYKTEGEFTNGLFESNRLLFIISMLQGAQQLRNMESNYGLLPFPKYDAEQEDYYSAPHQSSSSTICVPASVADTDMVGRVLEDMAYQSHINVLPKFIESHVKVKGLRYSNESCEVLDYLFDHMNYDIFFSFSVGITDKLRDMDTEFGILPMPKMDEEQDGYYAFPHQNASSTVCIPVTNTEHDMTGRILEDMAYYSNTITKPVYIDNNLRWKSLRGDAQSYKVLEMLLNGLNCDIFFSYRMGLTQTLRDMLDQGNTNIVSTLQTNMNKYDNTLKGLAAGHKG